MLIDARPTLPTWALIVIELAAACVTLTIAAYFSITSSAAMVDPDIWWHIGVGDWIVEHFTLPRTGILSQHVEREWVAYSWGFDVLVSTVHRLYGLSGIVGFLICFQVALSLAFLLLMRHMTQSALWSCLVAAASIYAFYVNPLRPVLFTLLFFTIQLFIIFEVERTADDRRLGWMIPLFLIWSNFHLQFVYGLLILFLYVASRLASKERTTIPIAVLALSLLACVVGPNGILPSRVALDYARDLSEYQVIQELGAINFRRPEHFVQLLLLMAACFVVGRSRRVDLFRALLLIVTAIVSFRAMRDSWFVAMASGFVIAQGIGSPQRAADGGPAAPIIRTGLLYAMAAVLALGMSFTLANRHGISTPALASVIDRLYPLRATEFIERTNLKGPMYNDFNWGGFLILRLPTHSVSIDPRADLYDTGLFAQSLRTANAAPGWNQDPDLQRANFVLIQRWFPLAVALAQDKQFRLVYQDHVAAIFVKVS